MVQRTAEVEQPEHRRENLNLVIGGWCAIGAGALGILQGIALIAGGSVVVDSTNVVSGAGILLGFVAVAFGILSILGGVDARLRTRYKRTMTRVILGMVAFGFTVGAFLGLAAVILIALSQAEFDELD